jgi:N-acetylmuramoyl-L-alanine amidase
MRNMSTSDPRTRMSRRRREVRRRQWLDAASFLCLLATLLLIFAAGIFDIRGERAPRPLQAALPASPAQAAAPPLMETPTLTSTTIPMATLAPSMTPEPTATETPVPTPTATPIPLKVAIIAGHRNNDSGAVCERGPYAGLHEVHVTTKVTEKLVRRLEARGYEVLDLDEFDPRLVGLVADTLISIHADSCVDWPGATGFKTARAINSAIPDIEDQLVKCVTDEYGRATRLPRHDGSITHNMTLYHAFRKAAPATPAMIIELGFLHHDHHVLTARQDVMVEALVQGIECFLGRRS